MAHPSLKVLRDSTQTFEKLAQHLCLSAVARMRLGLAALNAASMQRDLNQMLDDDEFPMPDATRRPRRQPACVPLR